MLRQDYGSTVMYLRLLDLHSPTSITKLLLRRGTIAHPGLLL